jgi:hypothetical protein
MAGTRRFTSDVEHVGTLAHHAQSLGDGALHVIAQAVTAEGIGSDVDDSHHIGSRAPLEAPPADVRDHVPIMLRLNDEAL